MDVEKIFELARLRPVVLVLLFAAVGFCFQNSLQQAVVLAREGHFAEARRVLKGTVEPADTLQRIALHRLKAAIASGLGDYREAVAEMHAALKLSPADQNLLLATAVAELKANLVEEALNHAHSAGDTPVALAITGDIEDKRGNLTGAVEAYRQAVGLAPASEQYRVALARELIQHQALGPAVDVLEQARKLFPHSGQFLVLLGIAHYAAGDTQEAIDFLSDALTLEPALNATYVCLGQIVLQTSALPSEKIVRSLCSWNVTVCAALQLRQARETSDEVLARRAIDQLARAPQSDTVAHCALGRAYEWRGQLSSARRELEACAAQDGSPQNHYVLALLYKRMGETALARRQLAIRAALLGKMSEQTAAGLTALRSFNTSPH